MQAGILRHALDRVPLSLIIDDSTVLVNLNYFFMRGNGDEGTGTVSLWREQTIGKRRGRRAIHACIFRAFRGVGRGR